MNAQANNVGVQTRPPTSHGHLLLALRVSVASFALVLFALSSKGLITDPPTFVANTLLLIGYLCIEVKNLWAREARLFLINPVTLASIFTFALPFGISNVLYFLPEDVSTTPNVPHGITQWMNQAMLLVILGACAMWTGYCSGVGQGMGRRMNQSRLLNRLLSRSTRVNRFTLVGCLVCSIVARLVSVRLGLYGYSSSSEQTVAAASYLQYLELAASLGTLALLGAAIQCYSAARYGLGDRQFLWLTLGVEIVFGFISGMKSYVVMPFVVVSIVYYAMRRRFPRWLLPVVVAAVATAYAVIEPFRFARNTDPDFDGTNIANITATMANAGHESGEMSGAKTSTWISALERSSMTSIASLGIEYAAEHELPPDSPAFLENILLAPLYAVVPRAFWSGKPVMNIGQWYTHEVVGMLGSDSSTGMSPFTYLNFAGGPLAVILGFLAVGIFNGDYFDGLLAFGSGGLIVFLGLLGNLAIVDSSFNTFVNAIVRVLPLLIVAQFLLLQRHPVAMPKATTRPSQFSG